MEEAKKRGRPRKKIETRGGAREGAGRPKGENAPKVTLSIMVTPEAKEMYAKIKERGLQPNGVIEEAIMNLGHLLGL